MKFARRFEEDLQEVGWEEAYLKYRVLKRTIHYISLCFPSSIVDENHEVRTNLQKEVDTYKCLVNTSTRTAIEQTNDWKADKNEYIDQHKWLDYVCGTFESLQTVNTSVKVDDFENFSKERYFNLLEETIEGEIDRISDFGIKILKLIQDMLTETHENLETLLETSNLAQHVSMEYIFRLSDEEMSHITEFGKLITQTRILFQYIYVNIAAVKRIIAKARTLIALNDSCEGSLRKIESSLDKLMNISDKVKDIEMNLSDTAGDMMCSSSCYYEYLQDYIKSLEITRSRIKLERFEDNKIDQHKFKIVKLKRITRLLDLEERLRPHQFLTTCVNLVFATLFLTYFITYVDKTNTIFDDKGYFISASIDQQPASNIGSLGLNISCSLIGIIIFIKHKIVKKQLRGRTWMATQRLSTGAGITAAICGMGVAAFQCRAFPKTHNVFAFGFFSLGTIHICFETLIEKRKRLQDDHKTLFRIILSVCVVISVITFITCEIYVKSNRSTIDPLLRQKIISIGAFFEIIGFSGLIIWFASFYHTFLEYRFQLLVHRRQSTDVDFSC